MATATSWISKTPGVCGGEACIRTTRHTVSGLVEWKRLGVSDEKLITMFSPPLTQDDLDAAWAYAAENALEIETSLWADRVADCERKPGHPLPAELIAEGRRLGLSSEVIRRAFIPPLTVEEWADIDHTTNGAA